MLRPISPLGLPSWGAGVPLMVASGVQEGGPSWVLHQMSFLTASTLSEGKVSALQAHRDAVTLGLITWPFFFFIGLWGSVLVLSDGS